MFFLPHANLFSVITWIVFNLSIHLHHVLLLGLPLAPLASAVSASTARVSRLPMGRHAVNGAILFALSPLLWLAMMWRMRGRAVPENLVGASYVVTFGTWAVVMVPLSLVSFTSIGSGHLTADEELRFYVATALLVANLAGWILSAGLLTRRRNELRDLGDGPLPIGALAPFGLAVACVAVTLAAIYLSAWQS